MIRFRVQDDEYTFDDDKLSMDEADFIEEKTGQGLRGFAEGLRELRPSSLKCLVYLARDRAFKAGESGKKARWEHLGQIDLFSDFELLEHDLDGGEDEDPTEQTSE